MRNVASELATDATVTKGEVKCYLYVSSGPRPLQHNPPVPQTKHSALHQLLFIHADPAAAFTVRLSLAGLVTPTRSHATQRKSSILS